MFAAVMDMLTAEVKWASLWAVMFGCRWRRGGGTREKRNEIQCEGEDNRGKIPFSDEHQ